jgi:hypothetical protein
MSDDRILLLPNQIDRGNGEDPLVDRNWAVLDRLDLVQENRFVVALAWMEKADTFIQLLLATAHNAVKPIA